MNKQKNIPNIGNSNNNSYQPAKNRILVDSSHAEEVRVVVLKNNVIEEYEFEVTTKEELKGNIYLAKVVKVESSLQAAFVEYGGKRQGFLPFNEISIDYFNLPKEEIEKIKKEQFNRGSTKSDHQNLDSTNQKNNQVNETNFDNINKDLEVEQAPTNSEYSTDTQSTIESIDDNIIEDSQFINETIEEDIFDEEDMLQKLEAENLSYGTRYGYKIQDVIKQDQYIIVQVVKEERGNKGASLTSYLSIPGRCCVLMPFTPSETRISKKINDPQEKRRLKNLISNLSNTTQTNIIIRTASINKTDDEIVQDFKYITTAWQNIQTQATASKQPKLLFEEANLLKRVIRDIYSKQIDEILINDKKAFDNIKNYAQMVSPDTINKIIRFNHPKLSLFKFYRLEEEIRNIYSPVVFLKSGGYIVINPTEALVAIDINSGKSKGRRNVEETALKTNLEATTEILKQIKLRDLGGLIVIDYIDMENPKNRSIVEKKVKELAKEDKAKIQVGQISSFGLLEISRQRIKASLVERSFNICSKCQGVGYTKPLEISALHILRCLQSDSDRYNIKSSYDKIVISMPSEEAFYILNNKREELTELEKVLKASIRIKCDDDLPYPFYKFEQDLDNLTESKTTSFIEQEIEINNKIKDDYRNESKNDNRNEQRKYNNNFNKKKGFGLKKVESKGIFKRIFGL